MKSSKPQPPQPNNKRLTEAPLNAIEQQLTMSVMHAMQLERTIWLLVKAGGGAMVIDEASVDPLFNLKYERVEGNPTLLKVTATEMPPATDTQIQRLADVLADQAQDRTPSALLECGLAGYPPAYVIARLAPLVQCREGIWKRT